MRVIFAGTPAFACAALQALHAAGHDIVAVFTQPDRPAGRGLKPQASAVKQFALQQGLPVLQPRSLRLDGKYPEDAAQAADAIARAHADVMVVAAYGLLLPQWVLDAFKPGLGCLNIHASLLPRWRGAAPIHRAIEAGDSHSGITIMQMDAGLDTGGIVQAKALPIVADDTTGSLQQRLADLGAALVVEVLQHAAQQPPKAEPQPAEGVSYAHKIDKAEARIDWTQPAELLARRIRAFNPMPGAGARIRNEDCKLWQAAPEPAATPLPAGMVLSADAHGIAVACGSGMLRITELQRAGGKRLPAADFLRGFALAAGERFETR